MIRTGVTGARGDSNTVWHGAGDIVSGLDSLRSDELGWRKLERDDTGDTRDPGGDNTSCVIINGLNKWAVLSTSCCLSGEICVYMQQHPHSKLKITSQLLINDQSWSVFLSFQKSPRHSFTSKQMCFLRSMMLVLWGKMKNCTRKRRRRGVYFLDTVSWSQKRHEILQMTGSVNRD